MYRIGLNKSVEFIKYLIVDMKTPTAFFENWTGGRYWKAIDWITTLEWKRQSTWWQNLPIVKLLGSKMSWATLESPYKWSLWGFWVIRSTEVLQETPTFGWMFRYIKWSSPAWGNFFISVICSVLLNIEN